MTSRQDRIPSRADYGTPELHERRTVVGEFTGYGYAKRARVADDTVVDALLLRRVIDLPEHGMLTQFTVDLHRAGQMPRLTPAYTGVRTVAKSPMLPHERQLDSQDRLANVLKVVSDECGEDAKSLLWDVCTDEKYPEDEEVHILRACIEVLFSAYSWVR